MKEQRLLGHEAYLISILSFLRRGKVSQGYLMRRLGEQIAYRDILEVFEKQGFIHRIDMPQRDGSVHFFWQISPRGINIMKEVRKAVEDSLFH